jgi:hypothetical protein
VDQAGDPAAGEIPAHVRNAQPRLGRVALEQLDVAVEPAQARGGALAAPRGHQLHPEADPEDGLAFTQHKFVQRGDQAPVMQPLHALIEGTDAGQDQAVRPRQVGGIARQLCRHAELLQHVQH